MSIRVKEKETGRERERERERERGDKKESTLQRKNIERFGFSKKEYF